MSHMDDIKRLEEYEVKILRRYFVKNINKGVLLENIADQFLDEKELKEYRALLEKTDSVVGMWG